MERISKILDSVVDALGLRKGLEEGKAIEFWEEAVGNDISRHTRPIKIRAQRLFVEVRSSSWRAELSFLKPEIIRKLNSLAGKVVIQDIIFVAGDGDRRGT